MINIRFDYVTIFTLCLISTTLCLPQMNKRDGFAKTSHFTYQKSNVTENITYHTETLKLSRIPGMFDWTTEQFIHKYKSIEDSLKRYFSSSIFAIGMSIKRAESNDTQMLKVAYPNVSTDEAIRGAKVLLAKCIYNLANIPTSVQVEQVMNLIDKVDIKLEETYQKNPILKTVPKKLLGTIDEFVKVIKSGAILFMKATPLTTTEKFEEVMERRVNRTREFWKWALQNRKDEQTQRLVKALRKMNLTIDEFVNVVPKIKYNMAEDAFKNAKTVQPGQEINKDFLAKRIKSSDSLAKDKTLLKGKLALLRMDEEDLHKSDEEWIKTLG